MIIDLIKKLVNKYDSAYPGCWQQIASLRRDKGKDIPDWPDWCYCPMAGAYAIVSRGGEMTFDLMQRFPPGELAALAAWKITKGVYRFNSALLAELKDMPLEGDIPAQVLYCLPEWGVCIETPNMQFMGQDISGVLAHIEYDVNHNYAELRLIMLCDDGHNMPVVLHLGDFTIQESVNMLFKESIEMQQQYKLSVPVQVGTEEARQMYATDIVPFLNLVLYVCAENAEYREIKRPYKPTENIIQHTHTGYFEVKAPKFWHLGDNIGKQLKESKNSRPEIIVDGRTHKSPQVHFRKAHWHHFWVGPRDNPDKRKLILHWLAPMLVGEE